MRVSGVSVVNHKTHRNISI